MKIVREMRDDDDDQEEVERVERPSEKARDEGLVQGEIEGAGDADGKLPVEAEGPGEGGALAEGNSSPYSTKSQVSPRLLVTCGGVIAKCRVVPETVDFA